MMNAISGHAVQGDEAETTQISVPPNFKHITDTFAYTKLAIEAYLVSQGVQKHSHVAELIMFMERSFAGTSLKGERSHYQHIMPCKGWRKGDTLSEKLTRCKDKETFKGRFDRIGTTAILTGEHFEDRKITNLDFKERMYLRLIDTNHNNLSRFYRNDAAVEAFIEQALSFYSAQLKAKRRARKPVVLGTGKAEEVNPGKPAMVYLENPKPLLIKGIHKEETKKTQNSLKLVHSSPTGEKPIPIPIPIPTPVGIKNIKTSDYGFGPEPKTSQSGFSYQSKSKMPKAGGAMHDTSVKGTSGLDVYKVWRTSVLASHSEIFITENPSKKLVGQANFFYQKFSEFSQDIPLVDFFDHLIKKWDAAAEYLKESGVWQKPGDYPEISFLVTHSDKTLSWYKSEIKYHLMYIESMKKQPTKDEVCTSSKTASMSDSNSVAVLGRTFQGGSPETLEYQIARCLKDSSCLKDSNSWAANRAVSCRINLKKLSVDLTASKDRIEELCKLTLEELEMINC